jgi:mono/diheme cytochrome c family protein
MPAYGQELTPPDRWSVVAYVRAFQRSQTARLDELPEDMRREAARALAAEPPAPPEGARP